MSDVVATAQIEVDADHPALVGHFPGRPLLPGVALLAAVLETAAAAPRFAQAVGDAPRLSWVKFLAPVEPHSSLTISLRLGDAAIDWQVDAGDVPVASGRIARADRAFAETTR